MTNILLPSKPLTSIFELDVKYMALDGCSTNAIKLFKDNPPTYYYGNEKKAEISCCAMDGSSCSRKTNTGQCRSGNNDDYKVTWFDADEHCKNDGMRLCNSQEELNQCCANGGACGYNDQLVWVNIQVSGKFDALAIWINLIVLFIKKYILALISSIIIFPRYLYFAWMLERQCE